MKEKLQLLLTGFLQVFFVAVNTVFLAHREYVGVLVAAFLISLIWSFNVKKVAFGTLADRLIYSFGATLGSLAGLFISDLILKSLC